MTLLASAKQLQRRLLRPAWVKRRFGVELEMHVPQCSPERAAKQLASLSGLHVAKRVGGQKVRVYRPDGGIAYYTDREQKVCLRYWVVQLDTSLDDIDSMASVELSSPARAFEEQEDDIDTLSSVLQDMDTRITKSCGLHVHLDMTRLPRHALLNFVRLWVRLEPLLCAAVPPSRRDNGYIASR